MIDTVIPFPPALEAIAARLEAHASYRVLRAAPPLDLIALSEPAGPLRVAVIIDTETTGLDRARDAIIDLAMVRVAFDPAGRIVRIGKLRNWLEDPGRPIPPEVTKLTGITDAQVAGRRIDEREACDLIIAADVVIAHNAAFDAPIVERRLPAITGRAWACSSYEVDWPGMGFDGRRLGHLLNQIGLFHQGHRAAADVRALVHLLAHRLPGGETVLASLVDTASRPTWRLEALGAAYSHKEALKARGYRWSPSSRVWWTEVSAEALADERRWLELTCHVSPTERPVTWLTRHR